MRLPKCSAWLNPRLRFGYAGPEAEEQTVPLSDQIWDLRLNFENDQGAN
jgi:hypothetical protein